MFLSKKVIHIMYVLDALAVVLLIGLYVYERFFGPVEYIYSYMQFMSTIRIVAIYNCIVCWILTVVFKIFRKEINDEFKCYENRIMELEKKVG